MLLRSGVQWWAIVAALGFCHHHLNRDHPLRATLNEAVFPVYILHQTVIVVLSQQLKPLGMAPLPEGLLLVALTVALCFGAYELIRRVGWLRPLFGLKMRAKVRHTPAAGVAHT